VRKGFKFLGASRPTGSIVILTFTENEVKVRSIYISKYTFNVKGTNILQRLTRK